MKGEPSGKFFVTGLPRSRTAWMSAFLTTGETLCYHEPSCHIAKIEDISTFFDSTFYKHIGVSESSLGFFIEWILENIKPRTLIIERDIAEVKESMRQIGLPMDRFYFCELLQETLSQFRDHPLVKVVHFNSLVHKRVMQDVYWHLMPGCAFDEERWAQFNGMSIEGIPHAMLEKARKYADNLALLYADINGVLRELAQNDQQAA